MSHEFYLRFVAFTEGQEAAAVMLSHRIVATAPA